MCSDQTHRELVEAEHRLNQAKALSRMREGAAAEAIKAYHEAGEEELEAAAARDRLQRQADREDAEGAAGRN